MLLIKIGGGKDINLDEVCKDIAEISQNEEVVLVHGANAIRDEIAEKMQAPTKVITAPSGVASVFTDESAIDIFLMAYPGLVNKKIVAKLQSLGVNSVGLSGIDGGLWQGKIKDKLMSQENGKIKMLSGNLSGKVEEADVKVVKTLLGGGFVPVITAPAISYDGKIMNMDNDIAIAAMVKDLGVTKMVSLFEAPGMLENFPDESSIIKKIDKNKIEQFMENAEGRMKKKIMGATKTIEQGVQEIYFGDSRIENPVKNALAGGGTIIC